MNILFPHFYRNITAKKELYSRIIILSELFIFFVGISLVLSLYIHYISLKREYRKEAKSLASWESLMGKFPNYPGAYYEAAVHAARLKDNQKALDYLQHTLLLNPSFPGGTQLKQLLEKL